MEDIYLLRIKDSDVEFKFNDPHETSQIAEFILSQGYSVEMVIVN